MRIKSAVLPVLSTVRVEGMAKTRRCIFYGRLYERIDVYGMSEYRYHIYDFAENPREFKG
mgnify:CR=1 FL=1